METSLWRAIPDYEIEAEIGCGNLTTVYRARRKADGRLVSIKVVLPEFAADRIFVRRFVEAASRAIKLDHPNIARTFEVAEREGVVYVVREYLEANCLAEWLAQQGTVSLEQAVIIVRQLASALDYAHSRRVMHGDINDRCIYIDTEGYVKLADFGLVQSVPGSDPRRDWMHGVRIVHGLGACEYLAPERVQGQGSNRSADIYALGIVAYQLLAGAPPFQGEPEDVLIAQVYETPQPVHLVDTRISSTISATIARVLAKRPELRYSTATEFARAFAAAAEGIAPRRGPQIPWHVKAPAEARKSPGVPAMVILTAIVVLAVALLWNLSGVGSWIGERLPIWLSALVPPTPALSPVVESPVATPSNVVITPTPVMPTPTTTATSTPTLSITATPAVEVTAPVTPGASSIGTTATPVPSMPTVQVSPAGSTPAPGAVFSNLVVAASIDADNRPVSPGTTFSAARKPLYVFFEYRNMSPQVTWGHIWLRGDQELSRVEERWPANWGSTGRAWIYYTPEVSYLPGTYQVQLLMNGQIVATTAFTIR